MAADTNKLKIAIEDKIIEVIISGILVLLYRLVN